MGEAVCGVGVLGFIRTEFSAHLLCKAKTPLRNKKIYINLNDQQNKVMSTWSHSQL